MAHRHGHAGENEQHDAAERRVHGELRQAQRILELLERQRPDGRGNAVATPADLARDGGAAGEQRVDTHDGTGEHLDHDGGDRDRNDREDRKRTPSALRRRDGERRHGIGAGNKAHAAIELRDREAARAVAARERRAQEHRAEHGDDAAHDIGDARVAEARREHGEHEGREDRDAHRHRGREQDRRHGREHDCRAQRLDHEVDDVHGHDHDGRDHQLPCEQRPHAREDHDARGDGQGHDQVVIAKAEDGTCGVGEAEDEAEKRGEGHRDTRDAGGHDESVGARGAERDQDGERRHEQALAEPRGEGGDARLGAVAGRIAQACELDAKEDAERLEG